MLTEFDYSIEMAQDIILVDNESFMDIKYDAKKLCQKIKANKNYKLYLYYQNDKPVGYIGILFVSNPHYDGVWIDLIAVREKYRNQSIGKKMIQEVTALIRDMNLEVMTSLVSVNNIPSQKIMESSMFTPEDHEFKLFIKKL